MAVNQKRLTEIKLHKMIGRGEVISGEVIEIIVDDKPVFSINAVNWEGEPSTEQRASAIYAINRRDRRIATRELSRAIKEGGAKQHDREMVRQRVNNMSDVRVKGSRMKHNVGFASGVK